MKFGSTQAKEQANEDRKRWVAQQQWSTERRRAHSEATEILSRLELSLTEHQKALIRVTGNASRGAVGSYAQKFRPHVPDGNLNPTAQKIIAGEDSRTVILAARAPFDKTIYSNIRFAEHGCTEDPEDLVLIKELDFQRTAVEVLEHAIRLQKKNMAAAQRESMVVFCKEVAPLRAAAARAVIAAFRDLEKLVAEDRSLSGQLDSVEIALLDPKPIPASMMSCELRDWLFACVGKGLIEAAEMSDDLRLEDDAGSYPTISLPANGPSMPSEPKNGHQFS